MHSRKREEALGSTVTASLLGTVRHAVLTTAIAVPMAMLVAADGFEGDSEATSAGELWLEVRQRLTVAAERLT